MITYGHIELYYTVIKSSYTRRKSNDNLNWRSTDIISYDLAILIIY